MARKNCFHPSKIYATLSRANMEKLIVILGPTASGKTGLSVRLAQKFNGEIVSADSRQIYIGMDIGTAKVTKKEMSGVPHHLIDIVYPNQEFTLAQYKAEAITAIQDIRQRNRQPFLVGGTGLYIQTVVDNLDIPRVPPDKALRAKLEKQSNDELFARLQKLDPLTARRIDRRNPRRLVRALEVCLKTKKPFSQLRKKDKPLFDSLQIGLCPEADDLKKRIAARTAKMIKLGLIQEVDNLLKKYPSDLPALNSIGYQEIISYLRGEIDLAQTQDLIIKNTWQYSRRQMTWFKRDKRIKWVEDYQETEKLIGNFLER